MGKQERLLWNRILEWNTDAEWLLNVGIRVATFIAGSNEKVQDFLPSNPILNSTSILFHAFYVFPLEMIRRKQRTAPEISSAHKTRCKQRAHLLPTPFLDIFLPIDTTFFSPLHFLHSCRILPHTRATTSDQRQDVINVL